MAFDLSSQDLRLLAEIGFAGIGRGRQAEAAAIFALLRALRPGQEAGHVGGALCDLAAGRLAEAAAALRNAPQTEAVLAVRAMVHARAGDNRMAADLAADLRFMRAGQAELDIAEGAAAGR